jgi:hypothetical protein
MLAKIGDKYFSYHVLILDCEIFLPMDHSRCHCGIQAGVRDIHSVVSAVDVRVASNQRIKLVTEEVCKNENDYFAYPEFPLTHSFLCWMQGF